jgi:hypothetical protein
LETFCEPKKLVENPFYREQRRANLSGLTDDMIDGPITGVIHHLNRLPCCFTLQCCWGHFLYNGQKDPHNLAPLPITDTIAQAEYRLAYVAFCIDNSVPGKNLLTTLKKVTLIDPDNIQFCCATWFWEGQVNSYALQVEPDRYKDKDQVTLDYHEARHIETVRNAVFSTLEEMLCTMAG